MRQKVRSLLAAVAALSLNVYGADLSATLRTTPESHTGNDTGVLAPARVLLGADDDLIATDLEVRGSIGALAGAATLRHIAVEHAEPEVKAIVNELHVSADIRQWYLTLGKRIVSWDVGYAFRPLDVIQQEDRRRLVSTTLEGIPVLMAERYGTDSALSIVVANPHESSDALGRAEPAFAVRGYRRIGPADWYAVARYGERTGARLGTALAYVASESLELHASILYASRFDRLVRSESSVLPTYAVETGEGGTQALVGASWTGESRISVLIETWHDARAWSSEQWRDWLAATRHIQQVELVPRVRAGLLASQAGALRVSSLHRDNVLARIAWSGQSFYPSADVLYTPADGGAIATGRLEWRSGRTSVEAGWRHCFGPARSLAKQLPFEDVVFLSASVSL